MIFNGNSNQITRMQLQQHTRMLRNARWWIVLVTLFAGVAALTFAMIRPVVYNTVVSFEIVPVNRPVSTDYQYGAYYELKASELYVQHLMSLFLSPAIVEEVYTTARVGYRIDSVSRFTSRFATKQYSAQQFIVQFGDQNRETAERLGDAVSTVVQQHAIISGAINQQQIFSVLPQTPVIAAERTHPAVATIIGLLAGFLLSIVLVYIREYFRE